MPSLDHPAAADDSSTKSSPAVSDIRSPKRVARAGDDSRARWFQYYAGFSAGFVEDAIDHLDLKPGKIFLDPWLGTGTTSEIAAARGYQIRGYDLNPAMLVVARARLLPSEIAAEVSNFVDQICRTYEHGIFGLERVTQFGNDEPLEQWLQPASARAFRVLESSVAAIVSNRSHLSPLAVWENAGRMSPIIALLYVGLFRTLRRFISKFQSSNPTWVKVPKGGRRIQLPPERIWNQFLREVALLQDALNSETRTMPTVGNRKCVMTQASSTRLPLSSSSVDAVLTSPPYCTRIDYVRATLPELAVIRFPNGESVRRLREQMIGTPTISNATYNVAEAWGSACNRFLSHVETHPSKASSTYYLKYYRQYFASAFESLREIDRVLKDSGKCVLVVQDSYYKDVPNDLPTIYCEMASGLGWKLSHKMDFHVKRTLAGINPDVKQYRKDFQAVESALIFRKKV